MTNTWMNLRKTLELRLIKFKFGTSVRRTQSLSIQLPRSLKPNSKEKLMWWKRNTINKRGRLNRWLTKPITKRSTPPSETLAEYQLKWQRNWGKLKVWYRSVVKLPVSSFRRPNRLMNQTERRLRKNEQDNNTVAKPENLLGCNT